MAAPTEGDFDIYGEEEGFEVAQQHLEQVRKRASVFTSRVAEMMSLLKGARVV
jgi:hypothetical protein